MTPRLAGARWRLLVHRWVGPGKREDGCTYDLSYDVASHDLGHDPSEYSEQHVFPGTEFDELVVGRDFIHIEMMDTGQWWASIGGVTLWIKADRDGRPKSVSVYGPGDYGDPVDGCEYHLTWGTDHEE